LYSSPKTTKLTPSAPIVDSVKTYMKLIHTLLIFCCFAANANDDPCSSEQLPVIWQKSLSPSSGFELPAIYSAQDQVKLILPINSAESLLVDMMNGDKSFMVDAKSRLLNRLKGIKAGQLVNVDSLNKNLGELKGSELNTEVHVMAGTHYVFWHGLLENKTAVEIDGKLISQVQAIYTKGKVDSDMVNKITVKTQDTVVFESCWFESI
jgi:hypothetical protein